MFFIKFFLWKNIFQLDVRENKTQTILMNIKQRKKNSRHNEYVHKM